MVFLKFCKVLSFLVLVVVGARGEVHHLGDTTFDDFVDNLAADALLLVDFYRSGCRHCQRLNPVLDYLERRWEGEATDPSVGRAFHLAKVDIENNPRVASLFGIKKIPDLRFVRGGLWSTYEGGRSIEDLEAFKERMALPPLPSIDSEELLELVSAREAVFILTTEFARTVRSFPSFVLLRFASFVLRGRRDERKIKDGADPAAAAPGVMLAATSMQHVETFRTASISVLSSLGLSGSDNEKLPALLKVVAGQTERGGVVQPAFFEGDVATVPSSAVSRWVENESFGLVSDFTPATFSRLSKLGRLMVLGIVDPRGDSTPAFENALRSVASGFGFKHTDEMIFGLMDGTKLAGFVETFNIYDNLPRLVVLHVSDDTFYTVDNMRLEAGEIEAFLLDVLSGEIPGQSSSVDSTRYLMKIWWAIQQGGAWSLLLLLPVVGLLWVFCDTPDREEAREVARRVRLEEKEARRLKSE